MQVYKLQPYCFLSLGFLRSMIINSKDKSYYFIPLELGEFLFKNNYIVNRENIIQFHIDNFIIDKLFYEISIKEMDNFQHPNINFQSSSNLDNLVINLDYFELDTLTKICHDFIITNLVFEGDFSKLNSKLLNSLLSLKTNGIVFRLDCLETEDHTIFNDFFLEKDLIIGVLFFNSGNETSIENKLFEFKKGMENKKLDIQNMVINFEFQLESYTKNVVYNKSLYFDSEGFYESRLKLNRFNLSDSGEISSEILSIWNAKKDFCNVCIDCEFKRMCPDKRLPLVFNKSAWYHKTECSYNPYIAKWDGEEGYRTLEECGVISNENEFSKDFDKISEINAELWSD